MPVKPVQIIAPTAEIARRAAAVAREMGMGEMVACHVANLQEGLDLAEELEAEGPEVFISRRGTGEMIKRALATPLVQIPVSLEDMSQALNKARTLTGLARPKIGFFALPELDEELTIFAKLLDFELRVYHVVEREEDLARALESAIADGVNVVIGGGVVTILAQKRGFPVVLLDSGALSLRAALTEAREIVYVRNLEKTQMERLRTIVNNTGDGVLLLDQARRILLTNPAALRILGRSEVPRGTPAAEIVPGVNLAACYSGVTSRNNVVDTSQGTLLVSMVPVTLDNKVTGAILFLVPAESITELGAAIHKTKHARGFVSQYDFDDIAGISPQIRETKARARTYAPSRAPVLLIGETGTGKELFAHAIHRESFFRDGPFVTVNCASLPPSLLESELFGYEEGAFTGAARKGKPGLFELAHRGSIFLDEISELDLYAQIRLLRVLQEHTTMRLGGNKLIPLDIRVIAATNRNLWDMVRKGTFRKDLFFRLNVLSLFIPPLRERKGDAAHLARHALATTHPARAVWNSDILDRLERHPWPGNVRELLNAVERLAVDSGDRPPDPASLEPILNPELQWRIMEAAPSTTCPRDGAAERERILAALQGNGWNRTNTARSLGMDRSTLYRKIKIYGLARA